VWIRTVTGVRGMEGGIVSVYDTAMREPIFIAANVAEARFVERLLDAEEIKFEITPEAFLLEPSSNACLQGLMFEVLAGQAEYCRQLLTKRGLGRGVVPAERS